MHQRYVHYNSDCLGCIHLLNTETIDPYERCYYDEEDEPYEMMITCSESHCILGEGNI